jgi:polysaccharide chain length determinant protein (PEP-CTERM system associated)
MDQLEERSGPSIQGWWLRLCQYRIWIAASIFLGWGLLTGIVWFIPAKYRSETLILVEQQRVPEHYVEPNIGVDLQQRLQSMSEQILSRTRLMSIIDKFHLYDTDRHQGDPDAFVETMRKDIGLDLVKSDGRAEQIAAFKISYSAHTSVIAQQVTAELTSLFIEENLRNRQQLSEDTTTFLETELDEARKNLDRQEQRLREFKSRYIGQLPEQTASNVQILAGLQGRLQASTDALRQAEQQKLYLQSLLSSYRMVAPQVPTEGGATALPPTQELDVQLEKLKSQLADLSSRYTPRHPDVVRLKEEITATEKLRAQAEEEAKVSQSRSSPTQTTPPTVPDNRALSPALQVESQLKANEFEIANRSAEIKNIEKQIDSYQEKLNLTPEREQELAAITRDHEQSRANYDSLLAKKNQSEMATNLERRQQGEQFRMIDPPSLPQKPYFPNRLYFSLAGIAVGLGFGLAIIVVAEITSPRIHGEQELLGVVEAPLLVVVPPLPTRGEERKQRRYLVLQGMLASVMLAVMSIVTFVVYRKG